MYRIIKQERHYPPTHYRHPCITFRVDEDTKDRLKELRDKTGKSIGQLVKEALGLVEEKNTPTVVCPECGETLSIDKVRMIEVRSGRIPVATFGGHKHTELLKV